MPETKPRLLTAEVARLLQRDVRTVHRMVHAGRLKAERVPGYKGPLLFSPDDVERLRLELAGEDLASDDAPQPAQARAS